MAKIGSYTVLSIGGAITPGNGEELEEITRPGVDGVAYRRVGKRGQPFRLRSVVDVSSAAGAKALVGNYTSLQGEVVDLIDDTGQTWADYIVLQVRHERTQKVERAQGGVTAGGTVYLVSASWILQAVTTT